MSLLLHNRTFYDGTQGSAIMDVDNFCPRINEYLNAEQAVLAGLLRDGEYSHVIELGCDVARCFDAVNACGVLYLGVDVRPELVPHVEALFARRRSSTARLIIGSADRLADHVAAIGLSLAEPILCVLPFNLFGNVDKPDQLLTSYKKMGVDIMVSSFLTTDEASQIRHTYYEKCGVENLRAVQVSEGVVFTDFRSFYSMAYHPNVISNKLRAAGYRIASRFQNATSFVAHATAQPRLLAGTRSST